uniref:Uncharacterized protein n=1 Tax=Eutreptiella gymnastica TaxID=73025 RepID=A0A7S4FU35_9EUGL
MATPAVDGQAQEDDDGPSAFPTPHSPTVPPALRPHKPTGQRVPKTHSPPTTDGQRRKLKPNISANPAPTQTHTHTHFVRETMSQQPINPLWSIRDTAGQKSLSTSLRTPRQAIQYKDMFEARRLSKKK